MKRQSERSRKFEAVAAEVFEPLQRYLLRRAPADAVDDLVSDVLLVVWRRLDEVPDGKVLPWCYGVARRVLSNHRRGESRRLKLVERLDAEPPPPPSVVESEEGDLEVSTALATLAPDDQELIHLWAWEQLEPREIALVLETTPNAVSLRLRRAKDRLISAMERQNDPVGGHNPVVNPERPVGEM